MDISEAKIYKCDRCSICYYNKALAEACCTTLTCEDCGKTERYSYYSVCKSCLATHEQNKLQKLLDGAETREYSEATEASEGRVFCEEFVGSRDHLFENVDELVEQLFCYAQDEADPRDPDSGFDWPKYCFAAKRLKLDRIYVEDIEEKMFCDYDPDFEYEKALCGRKELEKALDEFYDNNEHLAGFEPDYSSKYKIPSYEEVLKEDAELRAKFKEDGISLSSSAIYYDILDFDGKFDSYKNELKGY